MTKSSEGRLRQARVDYIDEKYVVLQKSDHFKHNRFEKKLTDCQNDLGRESLLVSNHQRELTFKHTPFTFINQDNVVIAENDDSCSSLSLSLESHLRTCYRKPFIESTSRK